MLSKSDILHVLMLDGRKKSAKASLAIINELIKNSRNNGNPN